MDAAHPGFKASNGGLDDLRRYLDLVFSYCDGHVAVRMLRETATTGALPRSLYLPIDGNLVARIADQVGPSADQSQGLYVVPCTVRQPGNARSENIFQTSVIPCDLDQGDIIGKQARLEGCFGPASLVVLSGGQTEGGQAKRHLYWRLTEAISGEDLKKAVEIRKSLAAGVAADTSFNRLTQPIRVPGSIHGKGGKQTLVRIERITDHEYELDDLLEASRQLVAPPYSSRKIDDNAIETRKLAFAERQTRRVRAEGRDGETRFAAISSTIGHWVRMVRIGKVTPDEAWKAVVDYNAARVEPPWEHERLHREFDAILDLDRKQNAFEWAIRDRAEDAHGSGSEAPERSEDALAETFVSEVGADWRHVAAWNQWFHWTGSHWNADQTQMVSHAVRQICRAGGFDAKSAEARRLASARTIRAVERIASTDPRVALGTSEWDRHSHLLNTTTGTLDLETGEVGAAKREDHLTQMTAASPGPVSRLWEDFLREVTGGDDALAAYLGRVCGYCLSGETSEQVFFFVHGDGGNGKSVFVQTVAKALGSYAATAPLDSFTVSRNSSHPTDLAGLRGKRLVTVTETEQGRAWAESRIKTITGGEPIRVRHLYQDFFEFLPAFKLIVVGNHRPQLTNVGAAMRRRLQLIPFDMKLSEEARDKNLGTRLEGQLSGVLGWMLEGYLDWKRIGLKPPDVVTRASEEYFGDEDSIGQWLEERCTTAPGMSAPARVLYESWSSWAERNGVERGSQKVFGENLRARGFSSGRSRTGRHWGGISLRRPQEGDGA